MSTEKTNTSRRATARQRPSARKRPKAAARPAGARASTRPSRPKAARGATDKTARKTTGAKAVGSKAAAVAGRLSSVDPGALASRFRVALIAAAAVLIAVVVLYGPACTYYQAWRTNGVLQERDAQASADTTQLEGDISGLMTEEGVKDEARRRGYVEEGETRIVVEGQDDGGDQSDRGDGGDQDQQAAESVPWYIALGDFVFQYQGA